LGGRGQDITWGRKVYGVVMENPLFLRVLLEVQVRHGILAEQIT